jgi:sec-independent protein translocase protein TatB
MAREFQSGIDDMIRDAELEDVRKQLENSSDFDVESEIEKAIDPNGELKNDLDMKAVETSLDEAAAAALAEDHAEPKNAPEPEGEEITTPKEVEGEGEEAVPPARPDAESGVTPKPENETSEKSVG